MGDNTEVSFAGGYKLLYEPSKVSFGFTSPEEVRSQSVKEITVNTSFDHLGNAVLNGLYDPSMGPVDKHDGSCVTCGLSPLYCPGHFGHINLALPCFNPLVFDVMYTLLKKSCLKCHTFRLQKRDARRYEVKFLLLRFNMIEEYNVLCRALQSTTPLDVIKEALNQAVPSEEKEPNSESRVLRFFEDLASVKIEALLKSENVSAKVDIHSRLKSKMAATMSIHCQEVWQTQVREFLGSIDMKKCPNCLMEARKFKKDGYSKIFSVRKIKTVRMEPTSPEATDHDSDLNDSDTDFLNPSPSELQSSTQRSRKASQSSEKSEALGSKNLKQDFLHCVEIRNHFKSLWENEASLCSSLWPSSYMAFFLEVLFVPPNKFRPARKIGDVSAESPQNTTLHKVIEFNDEIIDSKRKTDVDIEANPDDLEAQAEALKRNRASSRNLERMLTAWVKLQESVNAYIDSTKANSTSKGVFGRDVPLGVKQLLEKKEGLFRQNMMGKRVNFAMRSVISPDPYIDTNEIGIPVKMAKKLHFPEPITDLNRNRIAEMVRNRNVVLLETKRGQMILGRLSDGKLDAIAKSIENGSRNFKEAKRCLRSGDYVFANRQPTLHKPSIMGHKVRVINNMNMQTIRLHYANCNAYNADFDGDEINVHFPQNLIAQAEAQFIASTDENYTSNTDGAPLRGLIQDHVDMGVVLTNRSTFLTRKEYVQMITVGLGSLDGEIKLETPAVLFPKPLWTGKQVVSSLLFNLTNILTKTNTNLDRFFTHVNGLTMGPGKTKTPAKVWASNLKSSKYDDLIGGPQGLLGQTKIIFRNGYMCSGVLDKASFGAASYGLVHSVSEVYGSNVAGEFLSGLGRLFTFCSQKYSHTCAMEDLLLTPAAEKKRQERLNEAAQAAVECSAEFSRVEESVNASECEGVSSTVKKLQLKLQQRLLESAENEKILDSNMQGVTSSTTSKVISECLPVGQKTKFPNNCFSRMVNTGAKGSLVNHSQISALLGQQSLEGRRVPRILATGKTLPCFAPFNATARAGGYITNRFLTGLKAQEYYFHCMAGREGLVDTAVKTSRSGYLQRCLMKGLENYSVNYDRTIRADDGGVVQFRYGEDSLDTGKTAFLNGKRDTLRFLIDNVKPLSKSLNIGSSPGKLNLSAEGELDTYTAGRHHMKVEKMLTRWIKFESIKKHAEKVIAGKEDDTRVSSKEFYNLGLHKGDLVRVTYQNKDVSLKNELGVIKKVHRLSEEEINEFPFKSPRFSITLLKDGLKLEEVEGIKVVPLPKAQFSESLNANEKALMCQIEPCIPDPAMTFLEGDNYLGAIGEKLQSQLRNLEVETLQGEGVYSETEIDILRDLLWIKTMKSFADVGENVGVLAAQGIGEPSTQMTLNTFHLAGHGGANVTLGIPRMRELLMTASANMKTPNIYVPLRKDVSTDEAEGLRAKLSRVTLSDLVLHNSQKQVSVNGICVQERLVKDALDGAWKREYKIRLNLEKLSHVARRLGMTDESRALDRVARVVGNTFASNLLRIVASEMRRSGESITRKRVSNSNELSDVGESAVRTADASEDYDRIETNHKKMKSTNDISDAEDSDADSADESEAEEIEKINLAKRKESMVGSGESAGESESEAESEVGGRDVIARPVKAKARKESKKRTSSKPSLDGRLENAVAVGRSVGSHPAFYKCVSLNETVDESNGQIKYPACVDIVLRFSAAARKLLMTGLAELAMEKTMVKEIPGIKNVFLNDSKGDLELVVEGDNFQALWEMKEEMVLFNSLKSNNVAKVLETYGVEAARLSIINEISAVFGVYGIDVDFRHMSLVADGMTYSGAFSGFNRQTIRKSTRSEILKMSFEQSGLFIKEAALFRQVDNLVSPSSRIATGQLVRHGTGCFDILMDNEASAKIEDDY